MKFQSPKRIYLGIALGVILFLGLTVFGILKLRETHSTSSLSKLAKPVIHMDLLAPSDHDWISDHEIFFLREKNQGDFMCLKVDIRDGKETVLEALSPYLRDKEDRSIHFEMQASPSGKRIGLIFGSDKNKEIYLHDLETQKTTSIKNKPTRFFMETWLPDESGWAVWIPKRVPIKNNPQIKLIPDFYSTHTNLPPVGEIMFPSLTTPIRFLNSNTLLIALTEDNPDSTFSISLANLQLPNNLEPTTKPASLFTSDVNMTKHYQESTDQFGNRWIIGHMAARHFWQVKRRDRFPYLRMNTTKYQLTLIDRNSNQTITLDPDVEIQYPENIKLNPSGTHFSFTYQGKIWVARIADFISP